MVLKCLLHAAALGEKDVNDLKLWAGSPAQETPIRILDNDSRAALGWADDLRTITSMNAKGTTDSVYATLRLALAFLALPEVVQSCFPSPQEAFDAKEFLQNKGTIYLLGTPGGQTNIAPLLVCLANDLAEVARFLAAASDSGRLDPPLSL